jgi:hypothetical protein
MAQPLTASIPQTCFKKQKQKRKQKEKEEKKEED